MPTEFPAEDAAKWDRWFAIETNNRAWDLAANPSRTPAQCEEMVHAAGDSALHARHYALAGSLGDAIADPDDKAPFESTFAQVPGPGSPAAR